ncbi:MAG: TatD family hydrolase [Verrucomicrobiae bacterium]|nr:TatD family hydrolase [Verrucomicrobiae bacterium]
MKFFDAHNHIYDKRLEPFLPQIIPQIPLLPISAMVVNSARENHFEIVGSLSIQYKWMIPSFGIHPWYAEKTSHRYLDTLHSALNKFGGCIGEIGLDTYIKNHNIEKQLQLFIAQLKIAAELNIPASIHCVKAWDLLLEVLQSNPLPQCGILIHSYGGLEKYIQPLAKLGAYFSFPGYFARENKLPQRESFKSIPLERILVETDAPDQLPPDFLITHKISDNSAKPINSPLNLPRIYHYLAQFFNINSTEFTSIIENNFLRLFGRFIRTI